MHKVNTLRRVVGLITLSLFLIAGMGCNKLIGQFSLKRAQSRQEASIKHDAKKYTPEKLEESNALINKAISERDSGNFVAFKASASEASQKAKDLLEATIFQEATALKNDGSRWIDIAKTNQASQENPQLFDSIIRSNETGLKLFDKQKYEKASVTFAKVVEDVQYLLKNLQDKAKEALAETKKMKDALIKEGAPQFAPEYVNTLSQYIDQIDNLTNKKYNYRSALNTRDQASQAMAQGILRTKEVKSNNQYPPKTNRS